MVRVLKKADGTNDEGEDVDAAAELLVQAQAEISNKGSRGQLVLPLLSHRFHLGSPWDRWGFDDAFPMMLQDVLSYREWKVALEEINQGYTSSIWPKLVWVPFFFCLILGAVLEGVTQSAPQRSISVGLIVGAVAGSGLLTSLLLVWLSLNGIAQDMIRAEVTCGYLTERFRSRGVTFQIKAPYGTKGIERLWTLQVKQHVQNVDMEMVTIPREGVTAGPEAHVIEIDESGDRIVQVVTATRAPEEDYGPGEIFRYGYGRKQQYQPPKHVVHDEAEEAEEAKKAGDRGFDAVMGGEDDDDDDDDQKDSGVGVDLVSHRQSKRPYGGWCECREDVRAKSHAWYRLEGGGRRAIFVWRNHHFEMCQICSRPVINFDEARDANAKTHMFNPYLPPTGERLVPELEQDMCGTGWSIGIWHGCWPPLPFMWIEGIFCQVCLMMQLNVSLAEKATCWENPVKFILWPLTVLFCAPCFSPCFIAEQRKRVRETFSIDVSQTPFGQHWGGIVHDLIVVLLCPLCVTIQHVNQMRENGREVELFAAEEEVLEDAAEPVPVQKVMTKVKKKKSSSEETRTETLLRLQARFEERRALDNNHLCKFPPLRSEYAWEAAHRGQKQLNLETDGY